MAHTRLGHTRLGRVLLAGAVGAGLALSTVTPAHAGAGIDNEYRSMGGASSWLGAPVSGERCGLRDRGCYRQYQKGTIHWSPNSGGRAQRGGILARWRANGSEHGALGYPVTRETCSAGTCEVRYQRGRITWTAARGAEAHRDIDKASSVSSIVNKKRPYAPRGYVPSPLVSVGSGVQLRSDAAAAYTRMSRAAAADGVTLVPVSGYRSATTQAQLYAQYVALYGRATADLISARPGHSEHQGGLTIDVGAPGGVCGLQACFGTTPQGRWIAAHGHRYGFVLRYPDGYTATTGYAYEPWHVRYVGTATAGSVKSNGYATLESYMGLPRAPGY